MSLLEAERRLASMDQVVIEHGKPCLSVVLNLAVLFYILIHFENVPGIGGRLSTLETEASVNQENRYSTGCCSVNFLHSIQATVSNSPLKGLPLGVTGEFCLPGPLSPHKSMQISIDCDGGLQSGQRSGH